MNKWFLSVGVTVVLLIMFGYVAHGVLLAGDYAAIPNLYRSAEEQQRLLPLMLPAQIAAAMALVWLYLRGRRPGPWLAEGIRFGVAVAVVMTLHKFLIYYALQPIPASTMMKQILFEGAGAIAIGTAIARLNR